MSKGALPISAASELAWIGFSDTGLPCTVDTQEVVRMLSLPTSLWTPVAELRIPKKKV